MKQPILLMVPIYTSYSYFLWNIEFLLLLASQTPARNKRPKSFIQPREIMMGEGNRVASVILFTFTLKPGPHAHSLCEAQPPYSRLARAVVG